MNLAGILRTALANGGEFADIFYDEGSSTGISCEDGRIERVVAGSDRGVGIRVIADLRTAYAYTNNVTESALLDLARTVSCAVRGKNFGSSIDMRSLDCWNGFKVLAPPHEVPLPRRVELVNRADLAARGFDKQIRQVTVSYRDGYSRSQIANSVGEFVEFVRTGVVFAVQAVASDGSVIQTGYESVGGFCGLEILENRPPEEIALAAARRAVMMLGAAKLPGGTMPVVLSSEAGGTMVHEAIGHGLEGDLVEAGVSMYTGKIGEMVASPLVTVVDDATIPNARGSFFFDDEATPAARNVLVENGVLKGYLYDRLSGMKAGRPSTGNGRRESYAAKPIVRMTNTLILPGASEPADVVRGANRGLFVRKMGGGQVNTVTGDFVFEVTEGYLIENGKIGAPVRGATLTGNGPAVLKNVVMVGNDLGFGIGTCGKEGQGIPVSDAQPTLLISEITVGGSV